MLFREISYFQDEFFHIIRDIRFIRKSFFEKKKRIES